MTQPVPPHLQWFEFAEKDLGVAQHLFDLYHPMPFEIICYLCQQSAEKAIKALYIFTGLPGGVPRTHDLSMLLDQMRKQVHIDDSIYDDADRLTPYAIAGRYPSEIYFDEYGTQKALTSANAIVNWVKTIIR